MLNCLCGVSAVILNLGMMATIDLSFMILKNAVEGAATAFFLPARNAMTLGIDLEHFESDTIHNEVASASGAFLFYGLAAIVAYYVFPDLEYVFIIFQLTLGALAAGSLFFVADYTIDDADAKNAEKVRHARRKRAAFDRSGTAAEVTPRSVSPSTSAPAAPAQDPAAPELSLGVGHSMYHTCDCAVGP